MQTSRSNLCALLLFLPFLAISQWSQDNLSAARAELAACQAGDKLLFAGGFSYSPISHSKRVDIYDLTTSTWSIDSLSEARDEMSAAAAGDLAFFVGSSGLSSLSSILDIYHAPTGEWTQETIPNAEFIKAMTILDNKLFIGGNEFVDIYDIATGEWLTPHPLSVARAGMAAVSIGNKVMFAGGYNNGASNRLNTVDIYDAATDSWNTDSLSADRSSIAAVAFGDKAYFAGGVMDNYNAADVIDIYDVTTGDWSTEALSQGKSGIAATVVGDKILFAGGRGNNGDGNFSSIDILHPATGQWTSESLSIGRHSMGVISTSNQAYFAGGKVSIGATDVVEIYDGTVNNTSLLLTENDALEVFPNPCLDQLNVALSQPITGTIQTVEIFNSAGILLKHLNLSGSSMAAINVSDLPGGFFTLKVSTESGLVVQSFLKK